MTIENQGDENSTVFQLLNRSQNIIELLDFDLFPIFIVFPLETKHSFNWPVKIILINIEKQKYILKYSIASAA